MFRHVLPVLMACALPAVAIAQQVYRCEGPHGAVVFSQTPCGADAEEITIKAHTPTAEDVAQAMARARPTPIALDGELRLCMERAHRQAAYRVGRLIDDNNAEIRRLQRVRANNNLAGATFLAGIMQQIAALHEANATLRSTAAAEQRAAEQLCREERERRGRELAEAEQRELAQGRED